MRIGLRGKGVTLKLTFSNMKSITRSKPAPLTDHALIIYREAGSMLDQVPRQAIRLIGVGIHNLTSEESGQLVFDEFREKSSAGQEEQLMAELEELRKIYGLDFSGNLDKIFHGETLYRTVEYMRKRFRRQK